MDEDTRFPYVMFPDVAQWLIMAEKSNVSSGITIKESFSKRQNLWTGENQDPYIICDRIRF